MATQNKLVKQNGQWAAFAPDADGRYTVQLCEWTSDKLDALAVKNADSEEPLPEVSIELEPDADPGSDSPSDQLPDAVVTVDGKPVEGVLAETEPDDQAEVDEEPGDDEAKASKSSKKK